MRGEIITRGACVRAGAARRILGLAALLLCRLAVPAGAQQRIPGDGDPFEWLTERWGPIPVPPGATYDARCSDAARLAVFHLGVVGDSAAFDRAMKEHAADEEALHAEYAAMRTATPERMIRLQKKEQAFAVGGDPRAAERYRQTVAFFRAAGLRMDTGGPGESHMIWPGNGGKVAKAGFRLVAHLWGHNVLRDIRCPWMPPGPIVFYTFM